MIIATAPSPAATAASDLQLAADGLRHTAMHVSSGLVPTAWARHTSALARWAKAKEAARAAGLGEMVTEIESTLIKECGPVDGAF